MVSKGTNRLTRDNSGRITSVGGDGATVRGGRLKTASGKQRGTQVARLQGAGGRLRGGKASVPAKAVTTIAKRRKTDRQIVDQVSRISESAWSRDRSLSNKTLTGLDKAVAKVEARASRRMARATANENRAYEKYNSVPEYPGTRTKTNLLRAERQSSAKRSYRDLRDRAQDIRGNVRINAELTASVKRERYNKSAAGKAARRKKRATENAASKAWVKGRV